MARGRGGHKHRGALSELRACVWLLEQGYEVFRNVSDCGPIDLMAVKGTEAIRIDVKTCWAYKRRDGGMSLNYPKPKTAGVRALLVNVITGEVMWEPTTC